MHTVGLHSALAIKRQRKRRDEQRRARERRYSSQSGESGLTSPRASTISLDQQRYHRKLKGPNNATQGMIDSKVVTSIGMLHIGVVFLVLGAFLFVSGILPTDWTSWETKKSDRWWNELVAVGLFAITVGCFLIILNRVIARKEENDLEQYVQRQLTRSKSGHRLERDIETGGLTTKHAKRAKQIKDSRLETAPEGIRIESISSPKTPPPVCAAFAVSEIRPVTQATQLLEQITEEDVNSDRLEFSTINNFNPTSPNVKKLVKQKFEYENSYTVQLHHPLCTEATQI